MKARQGPRVAIIVSTTIKPGLANSIAAGEAPRRDYFELRDMLDAELISPPDQPGRLYRLLQKAGGHALAMAVTVWRKQREYDVLLSDQEGTGLLLALLHKFSFRRPSHVMISHYLTPLKKQIFFRLFRINRSIERTICYSTAQEAVAREKLGLSPGEVSLVLHPADNRFWRPCESEEEKEQDAVLLREAGLDLSPDAPVIASAGLEFRDYGTLLGGAGSLVSNAQVVIAAASPWSKRTNTASNVELPPNAHVVSLTPQQLRALYRRSTAVALPLYDVDFQAGSLVAYEAMACGKPVVITRTRGQNDIVQEGTTGFYVPVGSTEKMIAALNTLLLQPALTQRLGEEARRVVERGLNLDTYLQRMAEIVREVAARQLNAPSRKVGGHRTAQVANSK
jgi:glycosyltransferase involved in cell wall biosynthesis